MNPGSHIYFHSPCFDGVVSAVLAWDLLERRQGWTSCALHPVGYELRESWLASDLPDRSAVVDFLFHPDATFFADHHASSFLQPEHREAVGRGDPERWIFDPFADSCAGLIWQRFGALLQENPGRRDLVTWADKIDAARYESVDEALSFGLPALDLSWALATSGDRNFSAAVVRMLRSQSLSAVAEDRAVRVAAKAAQAGLEIGLERLSRSAGIDDCGVVTFDLDARDVVVSRYSPYRIFPDARYSAGVLRFERNAKVVVMRNPWVDFEGVPLGRICEKYGGGGHRRVGAVELAGDRVSQARAILQSIVSDIETLERREAVC